MDRIDKKILNLLQQDCTLATSEIAERVGLTTTPCWRRIQNLERDGYIKGRFAVLDRSKLNLNVDVFIAIKTNQHSLEWLESFAEVVTAFPEVVEFYRMAGESDYLLRVVVPDIPSFDAFYKQLIKVADLSDVSSSFSMEQIKHTTILPLDYV